MKRILIVLFLILVVCASSFSQMWFSDAFENVRLQIKEYTNKWTKHHLPEIGPGKDIESSEKPIAAVILRYVGDVITDEWTQYVLGLSLEELNEKTLSFEYDVFWKKIGIRHGLNIFLLSAKDASLFMWTKKSDPFYEPLIKFIEDPEGFSEE